MNRHGPASVRRGVPLLRAVPPDESALRSLVDDHGPALRAYLRRRTSDPHRADDLLQEVLLRAWRRAGTFDPERGEVRSWLLGIARNVVIDAARADAVRPHTVSDEPLQHLSGADEVEGAVEAWVMAEALGRLSDAHRTVLQQLYYRRLSTAEAARESGVPQGTVKSRSTYALRALRLVLEEMEVPR